MNPPGPVAQQAHHLFQRRHGNETVDPKMQSRFKPDLSMPRGQQMTMKVDHPPAHFGPGYRQAKIDSRHVMLSHRRLVGSNCLNHGMKSWVSLDVVNRVIREY